MVGASVKAPENTLAYLRWTSHILSRSPGDEKRVVAFERAQCSCSSVARYRFRPSLTDAPTDVGSYRLKRFSVRQLSVKSEKAYNNKACNTEKQKTAHGINRGPNE